MVLGVQGIREFEDRRKRGKNTDAFHDGDQILPEINLWHDRLKRSMRKSDIISPEILDLAQDKMLKTNPADRLTSNELCKRLDSIVAKARSRLPSGGTELTRESGNPCYDQIETGPAQGHPEPAIPQTPLAPIDLELNRSNGSPQQPYNQVIPGPNAPQPPLSRSPFPVSSVVSSSIPTQPQDSPLIQNNETTDLADKDGRTHVMIAAKDNNMSKVHSLLPLSDLARQDNEGKTVLHHAILGLGCKLEDTGFLDTLREMLGHARQAEIDIVNLLDKSGRPPLYFCVLSKKFETAKLLLNEGAWINPPPNCHGTDVFVAAVKHERGKIVTLFLERGARFDWKDLPDRRSIPEYIKHHLEGQEPREGSKLTEIFRRVRRR